MSDSSKALQWYEAHAREVAARYEALDPVKVHHWWRDRSRPGAAFTLDREYLASFGWMRVLR